MAAGSYKTTRDYSKLIRLQKLINDGGKMGEVHGIAFSHDHHWAVTDNSNNCVYIFNEQDQLVRKFGSHGNGAGQFNGPRVTTTISCMLQMTIITGYTNLI